ncbi:MAG: antitoxin ParD1/3/4 [Bradyrhizobium sp.]|jgi:antitoxin ParD1/3/4|nr:antitoxin ParD1/3/4 [Bradyrhizobium sp.]
MAISADLGTSLEKFVTKLVATGRYGSKSEVLREGVRLIQERETRLAALDASIARGLADADAGRITPAAKAFDRVESMLRAKAGTKRPRLSSSRLKRKPIWKALLNISRATA